MRKRLPSRALVVVAAVILAAVAGPVTSRAAGSDSAGAEKYFTNVELVNQNGQTMHLYQDLLKDKIVIIDAIYTTCVGSCPVMSKTFERIQAHLGDRLGKDVLLLSLSVDPETDTPEKLKEYADRYHAKRGWYFLTGQKDNVNFALYKLGYYVEDKEQHNTLITLGNNKTGLWKKAFGLAKTADLLKIVDTVINDDGKDDAKDGGKG